MGHAGNRAKVQKFGRAGAHGCARRMPGSKRWITRIDLHQVRSSNRDNYEIGRPCPISRVSASALAARLDAHSHTVPSCCMCAFANTEG